MAATLSVELSRDADELKRLFYSLQSAGDVADLLEVPYWHLRYLLYRAGERYAYRTFHIRKRSGGLREIAAPAPSIGILQSKLNTVLQLVYSPKPSVHGFVKGRSILTNAARHARKRFVLNIDLEEFFPSINFGRVRGMFMAKPYQVGERAATWLARLCCHGNELPQGAPTSPMVSNMICARLDSELQRLARDHKCTYTRYADDLTFSTTFPAFPVDLATREGGWTGQYLTLGEELLSVIHSNGFRVNMRKQRLQYRSCHQEVTGLTVNTFPNVRPRYVRQIRAMLHAWHRYGLPDAEQEYREKYDRPSRRPEGRPPSFGRVVRGKLDFLKMVKGEGDPTYRRLANKLHSLAPELMDPLPEPPPAAPEEVWPFWADRYKELVFQLETTTDDGTKRGGSAFAWRRGTLATAAHCLLRDTHVSPPLPEGHTVPECDQVFHPRGREEVDVALVRVPEGSQAVGRQFPVRADPLNRGEEVAALAYGRVPWHEPGIGFYHGVIESRLRQHGGRVERIQVTAELSGGMSGAPVIDRRGQLVGIVVATTPEDTAENVPGREFRHVLPVRYLLEIDPQRADDSRH